MGRPARDLSAAQVRELRAASAAGVLCADPSCPNMVADDGGGDEGGLCPLHRQQLRNREGRCPNCGGTMADQPIINDLTGRPRTSAGVPQSERRCMRLTCGYVQRERKQRRGR